MKFDGEEGLWYRIVQLPVCKVREESKDFKASRKGPGWCQRVLPVTETFKKVSRKRPWDLIIWRLLVILKIAF